MKLNGARRGIRGATGRALKNRFSAAGLMVVAASLCAPAFGENIGCSGGREHPLTGTVNGNVSVPVGATCVIQKAEISGGVKVYWNGSISVYDSTIRGDFAATGASVVRLNLSGEELGEVRGKVIIDGDVTIKESRFTQTSGFGSGTLIRHDVTLKRNHAAENGIVFVMCPDTWCRKDDPLQVMGDVGIRWNQVPVEINNLHIDGDLNCRDNTGLIKSPPNASPPPFDIRFRRATGQCAGLVPK